MQTTPTWTLVLASYCKYVNLFILKSSLHWFVWELQLCFSKAQEAVAKQFGWDEAFAGKYPHANQESWAALFGNLECCLCLFYICLCAPHLHPLHHTDGWCAQEMAHDSRPAFFIEVSKNGDSWLFCKDGALQALCRSRLYHCTVVLGAWFCDLCHEVEKLGW